MVLPVRRIPFGTTGLVLLVETLCGEFGKEPVLVVLLVILARPCKRLNYIVNYST